MSIYLSLSGPPNRSFSSSHNRSFELLISTYFILPSIVHTYLQICLPSRLWTVWGQRRWVTHPLTFSPLYFAGCRCKKMFWLKEGMNEYDCLHQRFCRWREIFTSTSLALFAPHGFRKLNSLGNRPESSWEPFLLCHISWRQRYPESKHQFHETSLIGPLLMENFW